jgi:protein TIF31
MNVSLQEVYACPPTPASRAKGGPSSDGAESRSSAVTNVTLSHWNPPPGPRALKGDLGYVRVETASGVVGHFVAHTHGFYLTKTTDDRFDPSEMPDGRGCRAHTLAESVGAMCPEWKAQLAAHLKAQSERSALETLPAPYAVAPWMRPDEPHVPDNVRAEDAQSRWCEADPLNPGMIRDWDDELQTLSHLECGGDSETATDPLLRDRALYK